MFVLHFDVVFTLLIYSFFRLEIIFLFFYFESSFPCVYLIINYSKLVI